MTSRCQEPTASELDASPDDPIESVTEIMDGIIEGHDQAGMMAENADSGRQSKAPRKGTRQSPATRSSRCQMILMALQVMTPAAVASLAWS